MQAEREATEQAAVKVFRSLGVKNPSPQTIRHDGQTKIAFIFSYEAARALETQLLPAMVKLLAKMAKKRPDVIPLLRAQLPALTLKRTA